MSHLLPKPTRALSLARDIVRDLDTARIIAHAYAHDTSIDAAHDLTLEIDTAHDLALGLEHDLAFGLELANNTPASARADARALTRALSLARNIARDIDITDAHRLDILLRGALKKTELLRGELRRMENPTVNSTALVERLAVPARSAAWVADFATRVLPVAHRGRYQDEYRSELYEMTAAGASWWKQIVYAIRLLDRSWELRYELRQYARRRARS